MEKLYGVIIYCELVIYVLILGGCCFTRAVALTKGFFVIEANKFSKILPLLAHSCRCSIWFYRQWNNYTGLMCFLCDNVLGKHGAGQV